MTDLDAFCLHYQPIFYLADLSRALGYEALLRHPSGTPPLALLEEARRAGAIPLWELKVFERACEEVLRFAPEMAFFNLTPEAFLDAALAVRARRVLEARGVSAVRFCVEVSEGAVYDAGAYARALSAWVEQGFHVALDDFGSGGSNMSLVVAAKPDFAKIDLPIVSGVGRDRRKQATVSGLVEILFRNEVYPILEGVEDPADLEWFLSCGWDAAVQGFLLARPAPAAEILGLKAKGGVLRWRR